MQSLLEFAAIKSCPELSSDYILLSDSLSGKTHLSDSLQPSHSYQRLSESEHNSSSSNDFRGVAVMRKQEDAIEIMSCQVDDDYDDVSGRGAIIPMKLANGESLIDDPALVHRKRVVRAVGAVTFLLLLFSLILIGISLNMSKEIDELVRQSALEMKNPQSNYVTRKENLTQLA